MATHRATFLYFLSTIWRTKSRDEAIKTSKKQIRILQECTVLTLPLQNIDSFYQAFDIQSNDGMYVTR
jgi:endothelin-converting enzyme/putative endopeptidase